MPEFHSYKSTLGMNPLALMDQNVTIHYLTQRLYRRVDFLEEIPPFQCIDLGALAAATTSARTQITNLQMPDDEFGVFRWFCMDNAQIRLFIPTGVAKFELKNTQVPVDYKTPEFDPELESTEFAVWEDNNPAIEAINGMDYALSAVRIVAKGFRYHTYALEADERQAVISGQLPTVHIWASGRGQG